MQEFPINSDYAVNGGAPLAQDSVNQGLAIKQFVDGSETGTVFTIFVPSGATNLTFNIRGRAVTAPGVSKVVKLNLYNRQVVDGAAVGAWSGATALNDTTIPTNAYFLMTSQTISLATLGITANRLVQFELTRTTTGNTLTGDWDLLSVRVIVS
jgi:hypothetical protein